MIVFYSADGKFIASVKDSEGGMFVDGDTDFLMQICRGQALYSYFEAHLSKVTNESYSSFEIPDDSKPPAEESEARLLASNFVMPLERLKFEFNEYPGFGSIGPIIMEKSPDAAYAYLSRRAETNGHTGFSTEWAMLERYYAELKSAPGAWETYLDEWFDDLPMGDYVAISVSANYSASGKPNHSLLVQLGHDVWVAFENFEDFKRLPDYKTLTIDSQTNPNDAEIIAQWIVVNGGAIMAALSENLDFDEIFDDYFFANSFSIDCATVGEGQIHRELRKISREYEMSALLTDREDENLPEYRDAKAAMASRIQNHQWDGLP